MIQIKPTKAGFPQKKANEIEIISINFPLRATESNVYWKLYNVETEKVEVSYSEFVEATEDTPAHNVDGKRFEDFRVETLLQDGNTHIPTEIHTKWLDDKVVEDYVLKQLGIERNE